MDITIAFIKIMDRKRQKSAFLVFSRAWGKAVDNPVTKKNCIRRSFCLQIGPVCMMFGLGSSAAHRASDLPDAEAYEGTATARHRRAHQVLDDVARLSQQLNESGQDGDVAGNKRCRNQPSAVRENQAATGVPLRGPNKEREYKILRSDLGRRRQRAATADKGVSKVEGTSGAVDRSRFRERRWKTALQGMPLSFMLAACLAS